MINRLMSKEELNLADAIIEQYESLPQSSQDIRNDVNRLKALLEEYKTILACREMIDKVE